MAGAYEQTIIVGSVGKDAELRYTQSGTAVCDFSVAVTSRWRDSQTNEQRERTSWYKVVCWNGLAETCAKYVKKGMSVHIVGTSEAEAYIGNDGEPKAVNKLTARDVQFLTFPDDANDSGGRSVDPASGNETEDIPF